MKHKVEKLEKQVPIGGKYTAKPLKKFKTKPRQRQRKVQSPSFTEVMEQKARETAEKSSDC